MTSDRPRDFATYRDWLESRHGVTLSSRTEQYYEAVTLRIRTDFERSDAWSGLPVQMREWHDEYAASGSALFTGFEPKLVIKPYQSFVMKTLRKNCVRNPNWPDAPPDDWLLPGNWYSRTRDLVRTYVVVKYLDGVEFVVPRLEQYLRPFSIDVVGSLEARVEGYYAAHVVLTREFEIPREDWDTERVETGVEIQVTTQLQEVMRTHLHEYYNERRLLAPTDPVAWQWDYRSPEFATGYLGHILHYVEGMIVEIRDKKRMESP